MNRAALLALVDEAARDPSSSRRLLEYIARLVQHSMANGEYSTPNGYIYAGAHTWIATADGLLPEPLKDVSDVTPTLPLNETANPPVFIKIPFDALILGVAGWSSAELPVTLNNTEKTSVMLTGVEPDGRDMFSVDWTMDGDEWFTTDGHNRMMAPAACAVGTRQRPRALAWRVRRNRRIGVRFRNLSNVIYQKDIATQAGERLGWPMSCALAFYALNMEAP